MKSIRIILLVVLTAGLTTSCMTNKTSTCFPGKRCNEYQVYTRCGSYVKYECEEICSLCKAYEPSCYSCWACIDSAPESCLNNLQHGGRCGN